MTARITIFLVLSLSVLASPVPTLAQSGPAGHTLAAGSGSLDRLIDSLAMAYIRQPQSGTLSIGILDHRNSARYFYGDAIRKDQQLPDDSSMFAIGALSQTFTATLLASLAEDGLVDLDAPLTHYLPDSISKNQALQATTLKHLANHSSGLPGGPLAMGTSAEIYHFLHHYQPAHYPGEHYQYSELGYALLGTLLIEQSGKSFQELLDEYINTPLSLTHTRIVPAEGQVFFHGNDPVGTTEEDWLSRDGLAGANGIKSSLQDLMKYIQAHFERPDSLITRALAQTRQFSFFDPPETDIGLAWHMRLHGDHLVYWLCKPAKDSSTFVAFSPDRKKALIILSDARLPLDEMGNQLIDAHLSTISSKN